MSYSYPSNRFSTSRYSADDSCGITNDEDKLLSSMRSSAFYKKDPSVSSNKSNESKSSTRSRQSISHVDTRDDKYSGRLPMKSVSDEREEREEDDVLFSLPESMMENDSARSKRSEATPIPRDLVIKNKNSNSTKSRRSKSSRSKGSKENDSSSNPSGRKGGLEFWSALSVKAAMAVLKAGGSEKIAHEASNIVLATGKKQVGKQMDNKTLMFLSTKLALVVLEAGEDEKVASAVSSAVMASGINDDDSTHSKEADLPSITASIAAKKRQLKAKQIELEEKRRALERVDQIEKTTNERVTSIQFPADKEPEALSATSSKSSKRKQLKARETEMEERRRILQEAEQRRLLREKEVNDRKKQKEQAEVVAMQERLLREKEVNDRKKQKEQAEVVAMQERLMALEKQLSERKRQLKDKEEDRARKQNNIEQRNKALTEKELDSNTRLIIAQRQKLKEKEDEIQMKFKLLNMNKKEVAEMTSHISDQEREINNKFEAIRVAEEERLRKEKEIEEKAFDFVRKEHEISRRLAAIDEASVVRKQKEKIVEEKVIDFTRKEREINDRLAAIDAASVARRKKEKEIEVKMTALTEKERIINEKLGSIETASVISRQKRQVEERERELEMEENLRMIELNKKEKLIAEKNKALEEAMQLNIQRENEIRERMIALDAATNALIQKANAAQTSKEGNSIDNDSSLRDNFEEEDWCHEIAELKKFESSEGKAEQPIGFFAKYSNNIAKAFEFPSTDSIAKAFDNFTCSRSSSEDYMPKDFAYGEGNIGVGSDSSAREKQKNYSKGNYQERELSQSLSQDNTIQSSEGSADDSITSDPELYRDPNAAGSKQINDSLNQALKASMQLYDRAEGREIQVPSRPTKPSLKMVTANPERFNPISPKISQKNTKKGGLFRLRSVLRKKSKNRSNQVSLAM